MEFRNLIPEQIQLYLSGKSFAFPDDDQRKRLFGQRGTQGDVFELVSGEAFAVEFENESRLRAGLHRFPFEINRRASAVGRRRQNDHRTIAPVTQRQIPADNFSGVNPPQIDRIRSYGIGQRDHSRTGFVRDDLLAARSAGTGEA